MKNVVIIFLLVYNLYITYVVYAVRRKIARLLDEAESRHRQVSLAQLREMITPW